MPAPERLRPRSASHIRTPPRAVSAAVCPRLPHVTRPPSVITASPSFAFAMTALTAFSIDLDKSQPSGARTRRIFFRQRLRELTPSNRLLDAA